MWFLGKTADNPLPPRVGSVDEIGDVIASLRVPASTFQLCVPLTSLLRQQAAVASRATSSGCAFYAVPMVNRYQHAVLRLLGFELGLASRAAWHADGWEAVGGLSRARQAGSRPLIYRRGRNARALASHEERLMEFLLDAPEPIQTPAHIRQVRVHFWSTGRVVEIVPMVQEVRGSVHPLGFVPAHRK